MVELELACSIFFHSHSEQLLFARVPLHKAEQRICKSNQNTHTQKMYSYSNDKILFPTRHISDVPFLVNLWSIAPHPLALWLWWQLVSVKCWGQQLAVSSCATLVLPTPSARLHCLSSSAGTVQHTSSSSWQDCLCRAGRMDGSIPWAVGGHGNGRLGTCEGSMCTLGSAH